MKTENQNPEYLQIYVVNHQNMMEETLLALPRQLAVLGYSCTGIDYFNWNFEFLFDYHDPKAEPSDKEIKHWLALATYQVEIERYTIE